MVAHLVALSVHIDMHISICVHVDTASGGISRSRSAHGPTLKDPLILTMLFQEPDGLKTETSQVLQVFMFKEGGSFQAY